MTPFKVHNSSYTKEHNCCAALASLLYFLIFVPFFFLTISTAKAQVTSPANISSGNPINNNNIGGTTSNTQNFGSLGGLGLNQGETFTFTGDLNGGA